MKRKNSQKQKKPQNLYFCPRCISYYWSYEKSKCKKCSCTKCCRSVLHSKPLSKKEIPVEDIVRMISYRKLNGYDVSILEKMFVNAPKLGVHIPMDEKPSYIMKRLRAPKAQRGGFCGICNHSGPGHNIRMINGGSCIPK